MYAINVREMIQRKISAYLHGQSSIFLFIFLILPFHQQQGDFFFFFSLKDGGKPVLSL